MKDKLLRLKPETHRRLKHLSVDNGISMGEMIERLMGAEQPKDESLAESFLSLKAKRETYKESLRGLPGTTVASRMRTWDEENGYEPDIAE